MKRNTQITLLLAAAAIVAGSSLAHAQFDGPPPPDGPMQGLMHRDGRLADRMLAEYDMNHDGQVTHGEFNTVIYKRFQAATHGAPEMTLDEFTAIHMPQFQQHTADMFKRIDWKGDGRITLDEFAAPQRAHFEMMDRDGSGVVSCGSGGNLGGAAFTQTGNGNDNAQDGYPSRRGRGFGGTRGFGGFGKARFCAEADLNKDGKVTRAELDQAIAKHFAAVTKGAATMTKDEYFADQLAEYRDMNAKMFQRLDRDRDGKLTLAEYAAPEEKLFARLDKDNKGVLTADELKPRFGAGRGRAANAGRGRSRQS